MQTIRAYISVINPALLDYLPPKPRQFVQAIQKKKYLSEEGFIKVICSDKYSRSYYSKLKSRTLSLLRLLAIVSPPGDNNLVKKKYEICQKNFLLAEKMLTRRQHAEGVKLLFAAFKIAKEYEFSYLASESASALFRHYVYYELNRRKAKHWREVSEYHLNQHLFEKKTEHLLYTIISTTGKANAAESLKAAIKEVEVLSGQSIKYLVFVFTLKVLFAFDSSRYQEAIGACKKIIEIIQGRKGAHLSHYQFFYSRMAVAQMLIQDFAGAERSTTQARRYVQRGNYNDYSLRYYETLITLRSGNYRAALELYQQNRRCPFEPIREQFAIIEGYLCFLTYMGYLHEQKTFRLSKYLNDTFKAQADKQGDNISILIAELLIHLARDRGRFIDRIEAVKNYNYRHLKTPATRRARWFIRILCLLPVVDFDPEALARRGRPYIEKLKTNSVGIGENFAIEIIPFEDLLGMIMRQLERRVA